MEAGRASSSEQVELCIARIDDPMGEGIRTFTTVWREQARDVAAAQDTLLRSGYRASPIAGIPVSIKDLLDVKGEVTRAGALALDDMPAACDAPVVSRLTVVGVVLIGRTNMTPFAFSVVGLNSHFGTPGDRGTAIASREVRRPVRRSRWLTAWLPPRSALIRLAPIRVPAALAGLSASNLLNARCHCQERFRCRRHLIRLDRLPDQWLIAPRFMQSFQAKPQYLWIWLASAD